MFMYVCMYVCKSACVMYVLEFNDIWSFVFSDNQT